MNEVKNVRFTEPAHKPSKVAIWENIQLATLALTIFGQVTVGISFLLGQATWLVANSIALIRDFILKRPIADKVKDATLFAITLGLVVAGVLN